MLPEQKKEAVAIFAKHKKDWTVDSVTELSETVKVQIKDMQHLRVCLDAAVHFLPHTSFIAIPPPHSGGVLVTDSPEEWGSD